MDDRELVHLQKPVVDHIAEWPVARIQKGGESGMEVERSKLRSPPHQGKEEAGDDEAHPKGREYPQESLPEIPANLIAFGASSYQIAADGKETVDGYRPYCCSVADPIPPKVAKVDRMRNDHGQGKYQSEEIQA